MGAGDTVTQEPPDWVVQVPSTPAAMDRNSMAFAAPAWTNVDQAQLDAMRQKLQESIWQTLVQFFTGGLLPGPAGPQISDWASNLAADVGLGITTGNWNPLLMLLFGNTNPVTPTSQVQNQAVAGVFGPSGLGQSVQTYLDTLWQTVETWASGAPAVDVNNSLAALGNSFNVVLAQIDNALGIGTAATNAIIDRAVTKPAFLSIDATADSVFPIAQISGSSPTFVPVTPSSAVIGYIGTPDAGLKTTVVWLGQGTTNITEIYITIYSVNVLTGVLTRMFTSPNILAQVSNSLTWNYYNLPTINQFNSFQGKWYAVEMETVGNGANYQIAGIPNHWLPANNGMTGFPTSLGSQRDSLNQVTFDGAGTLAGNGLSPTVVTKSVTFPLGDDVLVFATAIVPGAAATPTLNVTYNGVSMGGAIASRPFNNTPADGLTGLFRLAGAGTGTAVNVVATGTSAGNNVFVDLVAISYDNTQLAVAFTNTNFGNSTALSVTTTGVVGGVTVAMLATWSSLGASTLSAYNQTSRAALVSGGATAPSIIVGESATVGSVTHSATSSATTFWAAIIVALQPISIPAPASIATSPYSSDVPWFGLGGEIGVTQFPPQYYTRFSPGATTYHVPTGMIAGDFFDIVLVGDGGGGGAGSGLFFGGGGGPGNWTVVTLQYGVDIPLGTTTFTVNVGNGGAAGLNLFGLTGPGLDGSGCSVAISGYGTIVATGGAGGPAAAAGNPSFPGVTYYGEGPGNETFGPVGPTHNKLYQGGATQLISGQGGASPGGGGSGGGYSLSGGAGADGGVWITAYQGP